MEGITTRLIPLVDHFLPNEAQSEPEDGVNVADVARCSRCLWRKSSRLSRPFVVATDRRNGRHTSSTLCSLVAAFAVVQWISTTQASRELPATACNTVNTSST